MENIEAPKPGKLPDGVDTKNYQLFIIPDTDLFEKVDDHMVDQLDENYEMLSGWRYMDSKDKDPIHRNVGKCWIFLPREENDDKPGYHPDPSKYPEFHAKAKALAAEIRATCVQVIFTE